MTAPPGLSAAQNRLAAALLLVTAFGGMLVDHRPARADTIEPPPAPAFEWSLDARAITLGSAGEAYVLVGSRVLRLVRGATAPLDLTPDNNAACRFSDVRRIASLADGGYLAAGPCLARIRPDRSVEWIRSQAGISVDVDADGRAYLLSPEDAVLRYSAGGVIEGQWDAIDLGSGSYGDARDIAVDPAGYVYLVDVDTDRVLRYDIDMHPLSSWAMAADGLTYGDPNAVAVGTDHNVYVTTLSPPHVFKYTPDGLLLTHWGSSGPVTGSIHVPSDVAVNALGDVFVVDQGIKVVVFGTRQPGDPPAPFEFTRLLPIPPRRPPPATGPTVPEAIANAPDGSTILVPPGQYQGGINFGNRTLHLVAQEGPERTILDGTLTPGVPIIDLGTGAGGSVVSGFTIRGATGESAILVRAPNVTIENNIIRDNHAVGVYSRVPGVTIRGNSFLNNDRQPEIYKFGAAISVGVFQGYPASGTTVIEDNIFRGNRSGFGPALYMHGGSAVFRNNQVEDNFCFYDGGGVFVFPRIVSILIENNQFLRNRAGDHGGAIAAWHSYGGACDIRFNLMAHNRADGDGAGGVNGTGGALHLAGESGTVTNNTIVFNSAGQECGAGGISVGGDYRWTIERNIIAWNGKRGVTIAKRATGTIVRRNLIFGNNLSDLNCGGTSSGTLALFEDNLDLDPMMCDPAGGNYGVASGSPALAESEVWGAYPVSGCELVPIVPTTWSSIKSLMLRDH